MTSKKVFSIGIIENNERTVRVVLNKKYVKGLKGLSEYSHAQILWWASECDNERDRTTLTVRKPYTKGPEDLGVFAIHSTERPNPIAVSNTEIAYVDEESGIIGLYYIDAFDGTPVLDVKPYAPSLDRVESAKTPHWCNHWPKSYEESGNFDWGAEFNFEG